MGTKERRKAMMLALYYQADDSRLCELAGPLRSLWASKAAQDVLAERQRQIEVEGWTPEHDDEHNRGEMAIAAGCYALHAGGAALYSSPPVIWPWNAAWWKPKGKRRDLVRAAALILAEIERLDRMDEKRS